MTRKTPFGKQMLQNHFQFAPSYTPLNHGSFGAYPRLVHEAQDNYTKASQERPDTFIVYDLPVYITDSRNALTPLLGCSVSEIVLIPNATTGINTVLRNLEFVCNDVVVHFSTIYDACEKTLDSISELTPLRCDSIILDYPIEDDEILRRFRKRVGELRKAGKNVKVAMFDTVLTFPGARLPWEELTAACKELGILSLIDGAHGIGHIDLTHLGTVSPDFFVSNCHKWLYTPRGCAIFYVPLRNQDLIRTSIPTSHGYVLPVPVPSTITSPTPAKSRFELLFEFVATIDYTPYLCIPAALRFRNIECGGEDAIRSYCFDLAKTGADLVASILGTHAMTTGSKTMTQCCFATVLLPLELEGANSGELSKLQASLQKTAVEKYDTYLQIGVYSEKLWVRLSAQVYLDITHFEWIGERLKELCDSVKTAQAVHISLG